MTLYDQHGNLLPDEEELAAQRMAAVEAQILRYRAGRFEPGHPAVMGLQCPYCDGFTKPDAAFCCNKMILAVAAVCDRLDNQDRMDHAQMISDKVH